MCDSSKEQVVTQLLLKTVVHALDSETKTGNTSNLGLSPFLVCAAKSKKIFPKNQRIGSVI